MDWKMKKKIDYKILEHNKDKFKILGNLFPDSSTIQYLYNGFSPKLKELLIEISDNNMQSILFEYLAKSRNKTISQFVNMLIEYNELRFVNNGKFFVPDYIVYTEMGKLLEIRYFSKWSKIWDTFKIKYDAIRPYDMSIKDTSNDINSGSDNKSISSNTTKKLKDTHSGDTITSNEASSTSTSNSEDIVDTDDTIDSVQGFNSSSFVPSDKTSNTSKTNSNSQVNDTDSETETIRHGEIVDTDSNSITTENETLTFGKQLSTTRDISRLGNIGNITQQELIERERELQKYIILDTIYDDLDRVFTRSKYIY